MEDQIVAKTVIVIFVLVSIFLSMGLYMTNRAMHVSDEFNLTVISTEDIQVPRASSTNETNANTQATTSIETPPQSDSAPWLPTFFIDNFEEDRVVEEVGSINKTADSNWWVNSGAFLIIEDGYGQTLQGKLPTDSLWQKKYEQGKANRTDNGFRPQNIFRLLTTSLWQDLSQSVSFQITNTDASSSTDRSASNGVLLFGRYADQNNLYYAGIRVDGNLIIKKKTDGVYHTLAKKKVFDGSYDTASTPNLIPSHTWMVLKADYINIGEGVVLISLSLSDEVSDKTIGTLLATDDGTQYGGQAFSIDGHAGIRTDFMDVMFDNYIITSTK